MSVDPITSHRWEVLLFWLQVRVSWSPCFGISIVQKEHQPRAKSNGSWSQRDFLYWLWLTLDPTFWQRGRQCDRDIAWSLHAHLWNCIWQTFFLSFFLIFLLSLLSTGKRFPSTSLAPNIQNYVTGTMKSQHVFLMSSDFTQVAKAKYKHFLPFFFSICFAKKKPKKKNEKRKHISVAFLREKF